MTNIPLSNGEIIFMRVGKSIAIVVSDDIYLSVVAVGTGVLIGSSYRAIGRYRERLRLLRSPDSISVKDTPRYRRIVRKLVDQFGNKIVLNLNKNLSGREILSLYRRLIGNREMREALRFLATNSIRVIHVIIGARSIVMVIGAVAYYLRTRDNLFKLTLNTLRLFAYSSNRNKLVSYAFFLIVALTAQIWLTFPEMRVILQIWVLITSLNLSGQIQFSTPDFPISAFGVPRIEHVLPQVNYSRLGEHVPTSKISMIGKEDKLNLSLPLQTESTKVTSINPELETNRIIQNSTSDIELETNKIIQNSNIAEEPILLPKQPELQEAKSSRSTAEKSAPLKPRKRTNNLQNLKQTFDDTSPSIFESEAEDFSNISNVTKIKTEKVK